MINYKRQSGESESAYIFRICAAKDTIGTWNDVAVILNTELNHDWNESAYRKRYQQGVAFFAEQQETLFDKEEYVQKLRDERAALQKERYKLQTEKLEYNKWLREDARDELFMEQVTQAIIGNIPTLPIPINIPVKRNEQCGVLCIADSHYGKDIVVKDLLGHVINEYNPEVFEERMAKLLNEVITYCQKENLKYLKVFNLGDSIDGILRNSQLWNLRYGAVDSAIKFGDYMAQWLNTLSQYVAVEYHPVLISNHSELRLLDGKKDQHLNESAEKISIRIIEALNKDNPNLTVITNDTGYIYTEAVGYQLFGVHGEFKEANTTLKDFQEVYDTRIDFMIFGHQHTMSRQEIGVKKEAIGIGSICGIDDFSMKIRKSSSATASMLTFEKDKGLINQRTFYLN